MAAAALARRLKVSVLVACAATCGATLAAAGGGDGRRAMDPSEEAKAELGRRLFFDPAASRAGMRSCADCHDPAHGYSDAQALSRDDRGPTKRHSQTLIDGADNPSAHWDGEFRRIEDLVAARLTLAGKKGGGHGLGSERAPASGSSDTAASGSGSYGGASAGGRGAAGAASTGGADGARPGQGAQGSGSGSGSAAAGMSDGASGYGGMDDAAGMSDEAAMDDAAAMDDDNATRDGGAHCPGRYRHSNGASSPGDREPDDPAEDPAAPPAAGQSAPPPTAPPAPPPAAMPGAGRPDAAGASPAPAGASAPRPDAYADDAFGTSPDAALEFVAFDVDLSRLPAVGATLEASGRYREAFTAAFGSPQITTQRIADAIGMHCRALRSGRSAYDRFAAGEESALSPSAKHGLELFKGAAGCVSCHSMTGRRAAFTDYRFHDSGVSWKSAIEGEDGDVGAMGASSRPQDKRAFKTPTLRDVARRGPFMHDGSVPTLEGAVRHYLSGAIADPALDGKMPKIVASDGEVADLVAFLKSLTSDARPGAATDAWGARAKSTRLTFVDADGKPMANTPVTLAPAGDPLPGAAGAFAARALTLLTDDAGRVEFAPRPTTHVRIVLEGGLRPVGGALVPDTCRAATIEIPVRGHCRVLAVLPAGKPAPEALVAEHPEAKFLPDRRTPRTILRLDAQDVAPDGRVVAMYSAPMRVDVPARSVLKLPATFWGLDRLRVVLSPDDVVKLDLAKRK